MALTSAVVISLTIYAFFTETDFTWLGGILFVLSAVLIVCGLFLIFFPSKALSIVIGALGVTVCGLYLIYDTQLILGNKEQKFEIDDYVLAAMSLYVDIVQMFLYMLRLLGGMKG